MIRADRLIEHGELIDVPGMGLRAVWTPGHTPGHLCFHDEGRGPAADRGPHPAADHPNMSSYDLTSNPLDDYLASLAKLSGLQPGEVLPAHEYRFADLDSRLDDLAEHHQERLAEIGPGLARAGACGLAGRAAGHLVPALGPARTVPAPGGGRRGALRTCATWSAAGPAHGGRRRRHGPLS